MDAEEISAKAARTRRARRPRLLPVLIVAAATLAALRAEDWISRGGLSALTAPKSDIVDLGPGRPLMAQESVPEPAAEAKMADASTEKDMSSGEGEGEGEGKVMSAQQALEALERQEAAASPSGDLSESEMDMLLELRERRGELDDREAELDQREALLQAAEMRMDEKIDALNAARDEIQDLLGQVEGAEEERLARLVQVYEIMKPKEAAAIFDGVDRDVLLSVMERMNERKLAPILAAMKPALARELTADLSLRRRIPELPEG